MSSEYGAKSLEEMKAKQRGLMQQAEKVHPCVAVTEPNWAALIASQKAQIDTLSEIQSALMAVTTKNELKGYMNQQLEILLENGRKAAETLAAYQAQMKAAAAEQMRQVERASTEMQTQAGKISEQFSKQLSTAVDHQKHCTKKLFWISMIPSLILLLSELMRLILRRIFLS